jgi:ABC-type branched-subunit amino acid transport system substrate-binding protein
MRAPRSGRFGRAAVGVAFGTGVIVLLGACGSSSKSGAPPTSAPGATTGGGAASTTAFQPTDKSLGQGVTATSIKVGVVMIDYKCVEQFVDREEPDQQATFQIFIDYINDKGGIGGRKIVPVYKSYCPIDNSTELAACTSLTDDNRVFAAIGTFYDPSGNAQLCFAKQHHTIVIADSLTQALVDRGPPGLMVTPNITAERRLQVIMTLLEREGILTGKKVSVVDVASDKPRVTKVVVPALKDLGVARGADATLSISGTDTTAALAQLSRFMERWKSDGTNALVLVGEEVSSKQFVEKVKAAIPDMKLIADSSSVLDAGRDEQKAKVSPNPYDGIISAEGQTGTQHMQTPHFTICRDIWQHATGRKVPSPNVVIKLPNGKQNDIYTEVEDACLFTRFFQTIATRVGPYLNNTNWVHAVDNFGPIDDMSTLYASLGKGKYDADDTYGLVAYDPTIPEVGDWKAVTPVVNVLDP